MRKQAPISLRNATWKDALFQQSLILAIEKGGRGRERASDGGSAVVVGGKESKGHFGNYYHDQRLWIIDHIVSERKEYKDFQLDIKNIVK